MATKEEQAEYARLLSCLRENNQLWASQAPVLMVSVAKLAFDMNGQANRYAFHDVGLAVANLIVQATAWTCTCIRWPAFIQTRSENCMASQMTLSP